MTTGEETRKPRVFETGDPVLEMQAEPAPAAAQGGPRSEGDNGIPVEAGGGPARGRRRRGLGWGSLLLSALVGLATLAASVSFARFVSVALERADWVGWTAWALVGLAALAALVLIGREAAGFLRLARMARLRRDIEASIATLDRTSERACVRRLKDLYAGRADQRWALARLSQYEGDVLDAGMLLSLAEREVIAPLDGAARRVVLASAKRVSVVTAMSPIAWLAVLFVVVENVRMIRAVSALYGGRPGGIGAMALARKVVTHLIATGGLALTDDLLGQFLGQDILRRLSRRLGEGAFNGAMTARVGAVAIEVTRPMPFRAAQPVRARHIVAELLKGLRGKGESASGS